MICDSYYSAQPISHHGMYPLIFPRPTSTRREKAKHSRCMDGRGRVTVAERGVRRFQSAACDGSSNDLILYCHIRRSRPFSRKLTQIQGTHCH